MTAFVIRLSDGVSWLERRVCHLLILAFTALIVVHVAKRYLANSPIFFAEELAAIMLVWVGLLSISLMIKRDDLVAVTLVVELLPKRLRRRLDVAVRVIVVALLAALLFHAVEWVTSPLVEFDRAIALDLPKAPFYVIVPIFCATALLHSLARLLARLRVEA